MNDIILPADAAFIIDSLRKNGFEGHIVGGCVRDAIMGIIPHDYDITTSAMPEDVKKIFPHTFDTGIKHGTVTVVLNKTNYEVTTFRVDGAYEDCRHPKDVSFTKDIHEDLLRRDFTMNAIAYNPYDGYTDIFGGADDIKNKIIRGVGEPEERFREDALRMLRAVRFSAQLGFDIEEKTYKALVENASLIKNISPERIREELTKLLLSKYVERLPILWQSGLLKYISCDLYESVLKNEETVVKDIKNCVKNVPALFSLLTRFVPDIKKELSKYRFDNKTLKEILALNEAMNREALNNEYDVRVMCCKMGPETARLFYKIKQAMGQNEAFDAEETFDKVMDRGDCVSLKNLAISGKDLAGIGFKQGKEMGETLNYLLHEVLKTPSLNKREILIDMAIEKSKK